MARKGPGFEREFCRLLSEWWTEGRRDDCFWRTAGSGARATVRGRNGKKTAGGCGDIAATDEEGKPLTDLITWELKNGYNKDNIHALLDKPERFAEQTYEKWMEQAKLSAGNAGSPFWAIVHKRDYREPIIWMPEEFWGWDYVFSVVDTDSLKFKGLWGTRLTQWFGYLNPSLIKEGKCTKSPS